MTTPYRSPEELPPEAPQPTSPLRCSACDVPVADEEGARCPKCLRKTTVVDTRIAPAAKALADDLERAELPAISGAIWPINDTCPLCAEAPIGDGIVFLRVAKVASGFGSAIVSVFFRVRVCDACAELRSRRVLGGAAVLSLLALLFGGFGHVGWPEASPALVVAGFVGLVAIFVVAVAWNRRLRRHLDAAQITTVLAASIPAPQGIFEWENATFHGELPSGREAIPLDAALEVLTRDG